MSISDKSATAPRKVLLVDDNQDAADLLAQLLNREADLEVTTACSGSDALRLAPGLMPQVVVLDLGLPDMDGQEAMQKLKILPGLQSAVYIALTGRSSRTELEQAHNAGFDHLFVKPPDLQALRVALRQPGSAAPFAATDC